MLKKTKNAKKRTVLMITLFSLMQLAVFIFIGILVFYKVAAYVLMWPVGISLLVLYWISTTIKDEEGMK